MNLRTLHLPTGWLWRPAGGVRVLLLLAGWVLLVLALLGVVGYLHSGGVPATIALSAFAPYLLFAAVPALVCFGFARQWPTAVLALALVVGFVVVQVPLYTSTDTPPATAPGFTVMTANLQLGHADPAALVRTVRERHVDALMVQELSSDEQDRLEAAGIDAELPYRNSAPGGGASGTGLWSRYPLTNVAFGNLSFNHVVVRVRVPGVPQLPTLVALHVGGPVPDATNWLHDLARLPAMLRALPGDAPVLVGGDFNATRSVPQFRALLTGGYADAADQAGAGLTRTYPSDTWLPPLLGIDHVLSRGAVARSVDTVTIPGSDHRALVVRLALSAGADTR